MTMESFHGATRRFQSNQYVTCVVRRWILAPWWVGGELRVPGSRAAGEGGMCHWDLPLTKCKREALDEYLERVWGHQTALQLLCKT